jgi:hypothetical protein
LAYFYVGASAKQRFFGSSDRGSDMFRAYIYIIKNIPICTEAVLERGFTSVARVGKGCLNDYSRCRGSHNKADSGIH